MQYTKLVCLVIWSASVLSGCANFRPVARGFKGPGPFQTAVRESSPFRAPLSPKPVRGPFALSWPVTHVRLNRGFKGETRPHHYGVDLGGTRGTPIYAAHPGTVIYAGAGFHGYGNMVMVEFDHHWASLYAHLDQINKRAGQIVSPGDQIGTMGSTGHATGVHVHFELIKDRHPIDPAHYLALTPQKRLTQAAPPSPKSALYF